MTIMTGCMRPGVRHTEDGLFIFDVWEDPLLRERLGEAGITPSFQLPDRTVLEDHLDLLPGEPAAGRTTASQVPTHHPRPASLSRRRRPPSGLHRFQFTRPRLQ
jgi:hypothetical protein